MKSFFLKQGKLGLVITLSVLITACNPTEYFPTKESVLGGDAYCAEAKDATSCAALAPRCQSAFSDLETENQEPLFMACIQDPSYVDPNAPVDGTDDTTPDDSTSPGQPGNGNGNNNGTNPLVDNNTVPTLDETIAAKCANLNDKYLFRVKVESKNKTQIVSKVKFCHSTDKSEHTIIIACPALKAHAQHHDGQDYLGACR